MLRERSADKTQTMSSRNYFFAILSNQFTAETRVEGPPRPISAAISPSDLPAAVRGVKASLV